MIQRLHPQDLRALGAFAHLIESAITRRDASNAQLVEWTDHLLAEVEHTAKPEPCRKRDQPGPKEFAHPGDFQILPAPPSQAEAAFRALSHALGNPALHVGEDETMENALVEVAITKLEEATTAKRLLGDMNDLLESHRIEEAEVRKNMGPLAAISGVQDWGSNAFGLKVMAEKILDGQRASAAVKDNLERQVLHLSALRKTQEEASECKGAMRERERIIALLKDANPDDLKEWFGWPDGHAEFNEAKTRAALEPK